MVRFKDRSMQEMYETCRRMAADKTSTFYNADGTRHTGAAHRNYYWRGLDDIRPVTLAKNTLAYACWRAGMDDRTKKQ